MWKHPRLSSLVLVAILACSLGLENDNKKEATRWRWPDELNPLRSGAGRLIPSRQPVLSRVVQQNTKAHQPPNGAFLINPDHVPGPASGLGSPKRPQEATTPKTRRPTTTTPSPQGPETDKVTKIEENSDAEPSTSGSGIKNSSVPLLKDAGKPGNPYILLNDIFPPKNSIRTKEEEAANLNALKDKDIGNLDPSEVWLADDDLFVVRGFNYKKPYSPDPSGHPMSDYEAPAPNPPPPPEPGTVFYPTNDTGNPFNFFHPDFNSTDPSSLPFFPFVPGGLNETGRPLIDFQNFPPPFPFLPPPPPHWTEEKEFNNNELLAGGVPGNFPFAQGPGQGPPSGLNGFPQFPEISQIGQFGQQPPPGFPTAGFPSFTQEGFPVRPQGFPPNGQGFPPNGQGFPPNGQGFPPNGQGFPPNGQGFPPNGQGFPPNGQGFSPNGGIPPGGTPPNNPKGALEAPGAPEGNLTVVDDDDGVPFTPLFPERPVEFYYPTHNTTAQPPGPFGPGIFVPPPMTFFAPRNESEVIDVKIPEKLLRPPFNLPNYYQKRPAWRPIVPQRTSPNGELANLKRPEAATIPVRNPALPNPISHFIPSIGLSNSANIKVVPGPNPILLDTQFKEVEKLPQVHQVPLLQTNNRPQEPSPQKHAPMYQPGHQPAFPYNFDIFKNQYGLKQPLANYGHQHASPGVVSLQSDIEVNNKFPRPNVDPDSEIIDPSLFQPSTAWSPYSVHNTPPSPYAHPHFGQPRQPTTGHRTTSAMHSVPTAATDSSKKSVNYVRVFGAGGGYSYPVGKRR